MFEELKEEVTDTKESAAKNLSLKLLNVSPFFLTMTVVRDAGGSPANL